MTETTALKIVDHQLMPGDNVVIKFVAVDGQKITYQPGQFLVFSFIINGKEIRRSYSICSTPFMDEPLTIAVKLVENGEITKFLHHKIGIGDVLQALQPSGIFTYTPLPSLKRTVFLFAAGIGITPIYAILKTALLADEAAKVVLVYSNKTVNDTLFYEELKVWEQNYPERLKVIYIFSDTKNLLKARLNNVRIENIVNTFLEYNKEDALFYTCGPINYMVLCRITLRALGFPQEQIKRETYFIPEDEVDEDDMTEKAPKDTNTYTVMIDYQGKTHHLEVPYYKRILDVALDQNINLPYSCRAGMCSTCTATCTSGGVRMEYNEVLTDEEIENGRVLICTGHPTANNTHIVIG
ncbi:ring-1,2-phenylacetyl-CoA epoxidase subunit PaaE [Pedobacter sp. CAN_A7]|uniref:2Fe-2S iron-sulfur cluster-binding protein n=1 Tax=Pedobacter sp. CAN_A7 TaxID=2787722 RepID=UPI0018C986B1